MQLRTQLWTLATLLAIGAVGCGSGSNDHPANIAGGGSTNTSGGNTSGGKSSGGEPSRAGTTSTPSGGAMDGSGGMVMVPHTVQSCDKLPAAGKWEQITPAGVTFSAVVFVDPFDAGELYVSGKDMGLLKSEDCGASWTHVNTGKNGKALDTGSIVSVAFDPIDKGVIYLTPIYGAGGLWKSTNGGVDWENLFPEGSDVFKTVEFNFMDSISMDPADHLHLVVGTHAACAAPYAPACQAETTDGGKTWKIMKIPGEGWQEQAGPWVVDDKTWLYAAPSGLYLTEDHGASWKPLTVAGGATTFGGGEVENHGINRGADGTYYMTSYQGLARTKGDLHTWELIPNSGGRIVSLVLGDGNIYTADQWSPSYHIASESDPLTWTDYPPPYTEPKDTGGVFLDYDKDHHILYSSNFGGGVWRIVTR